MTAASTPRFGLIVEGHGEVEALPVLLRRIVPAIDPAVMPSILSPDRRQRGALTRAGGVEQAVERLGALVGPQGGVFVLLDADDDCPATLGPALLARAQAARADVFLSVVFANREFEAWLLASAESLAGRRGLPVTLQRPPNPEAVRDAKGWLNSHMAGSQTYNPPIDQPALAARLDVAQARTHAPSFAKLYRDVERFLKAFQH